jgi:hypothetical protein
VSLHVNKGLAGAPAEAIDDTGFTEIHCVLSPGGRVIVGFLLKERMDRMGLPRDIFTTRAPDDIIAALAKAGFEGVRAERPKPTTSGTSL